MESSTVKILALIIPFLLGLFSSLIIDKIRLHYKKRKIKKFTLAYLEKSILNNLPILIDGYIFAKNYINEYSQEQKKIHVYEGFNAKVLQGVSPIDYYEIFKDEFVLLNEITSMIEFISKNLPLEIMNDYYDFINNHLKEKQFIGDIRHVKDCITCRERKQNTISNIDNRIVEVEKLRNKIKELIINCS